MPFTPTQKSECAYVRGLLVHDAYLTNVLSHLDASDDIPSGAHQFENLHDNGPRIDTMALALSTLREDSEGSHSRDDQPGTALVSLALIIFLLIRNSWLNDDSFITFRVMDNFVHGYGLRWNVDERVQTYTNPLWLFLLTPLYFITREIFFTVQITSMVISLWAIWIVLSSFATSFNRRVFAVCCFVASAAFIDYSSSGLENPLTHLLLALFFRAFSRNQGNLEALGRLSSLGALLALNRLDTILLVAPALAYVFYGTAAPLLRRFAVMALGFAPLGAWLVFAVIYYGAPFPNSFYAKCADGIGLWSFMQQGLVYYLDSLGSDPITLSVIALCLAQAFMNRRELPLALGVTCYLLYTLSVGGDFMSGRFFAAPFFCAVILGSKVLPLTSPRYAACLAVVMAGVFCGKSRMPWAEPGPAPRIPSSGIVNEKEWYYNSTGILKWTRGGSLEKYPFAMTGIEWAQGNETLYVTGCVGMAGFFAGPAIHVIDWNAITDPLLSRLDSADDSLWRIGHLTRAVPDGYLESVRSGRNAIRDRGTARLWEAVSAVTRGPIFSTERLLAIVQLNLSGPKSFLNVEPLKSQVLSTRVEDGEPWNGPSSIVMSKRGERFTYATPVHPVRLSIGADCNDSYLVTLRNSGRDIVEYRLPQVLSEKCGIAERHLKLEDFVTREGFDEVKIAPITGDGLFSVAYVLPERNPARRPSATEVRVDDSGTLMIQSTFQP